MCMRSGHWHETPVLHMRVARRWANIGRSEVKEPVDHILRPRLPWRTDEAAITECGYDASRVKALTRPEFFQRLKEMGRQRTAVLTCMICADTANRWGTWDDDPRRAMDREIAWEYGGGYRAREDRGQRLKDELVAIAALIESHRDEFEALVTSGVQRREWLEKKAAMGHRPRPSDPTRL